MNPENPEIPINKKRAMLCEDAILAELDNPQEFVINSMKYGVIGYRQVPDAQILEEWIEQVKDMSEQEVNEWIHLHRELPPMGGIDENGRETPDK